MARSWTNNPAYAVDSHNGNGWTSGQIPTLAKPADFATTGEIEVIKDVSTAEWFRPDSVGSPVFHDNYGGRDTLANLDTLGGYNSGNSGSSAYVMTDAEGNRTTFNAFDGTQVADPAAPAGAFLGYQPVNGSRITTTYGSAGGYASGLTAGNVLTGLTRSELTPGGAVAEQFAYSYVQGGPNDGELADVTLSRSVDGGPPAVVRRVAYTYYQGTYTGDDAFGNLNDLRTAAVEDPAGNVLSTHYYRYYTSSDGVPTDGGYTGSLLKYEFTPEEFARLDQAASLQQGTTALTADDKFAAAYARLFLEYNSTAQASVGGTPQSFRQVTREVVGGVGAGGPTYATRGIVGGIGQGTYTFDYGGYDPSGTGGTDPSLGQLNSWSYRTVVQQPSGQLNSYYLDYAGLPIITDLYDPVAAQHSITYDRYDAQGNVVLEAQPSAVVTYDTAQPGLVVDQYNNYFGLSPGSGLINATQYWGDAPADTFGRPDPNAAGAAPGRVRDHQVLHGIGDSSPAITDGYGYVPQQIDAATVYRLSDTITYRNPDGTGAQDTHVDYQYASDGYVSGGYAPFAIASVTTTLPTVAAAQNGPGSAATTTDVLDPDGHVAWERDADGYIHFAQYDPATGGLVESVADVNARNTGGLDGPPLPAGWSTPAGGGLHLVTTYGIDDQGRTTQQTTPNGNVWYTTYDDVHHVTAQYAGWVQNADGTYGPTGPVRVAWADWADGYAIALTYAYRPTTDATPPADDSQHFPDLLSLQVDKTDEGGQRVETDRFADVSRLYVYTTGNTSYILPTDPNPTFYEYDAGGHQYRTTSPNGTVTENQFDTRGRVRSTAVGTYNGSLTTVADYAYDPDGDLTQVVAHPGGGRPDQPTTFLYDARDRRVTTAAGPGGGTPGIVTTTDYDNLGRVTATRQYAYASGTAGTASYTPGATNASRLQAQSITAYDDQGRVYRAAAYAVDPATGTVGTADTADVFYDGRGDAIAARSPTGLWTKTTFDGAGRPTATFQTNNGGSGYAAAAGLSSDAVITQTQHVYDADGNPIESITGDRIGTDSPIATGMISYSNTFAAGRLSYTAAYYDAADRPTAAVDVGTNGGTAWTRPAAPPARSDVALVNITTYDPAGNVAAATDPRGLVTAYQYDALHRTTRTVANYTGNGTPTNAANQTTAYAYDPADHVVAYTAVLPSGQPSQTTRYVYGVTAGQGSGADNADLLAQVQYPDPATGAANASQAETYTYDALGERTTLADRNGTTHAYAYDALGRPTADAVTHFGPGVDPGVDPGVSAVGYAYDDAGLVKTATSYAGTQAGPGMVVNQDARTYDGFGRLAAERQAVAGTAGPSTPTVGYAHDAANGDRPTGLAYPNGRTLTYAYGSAGSITSAASQVTSISDPAGPVQSYTYLGLTRPVSLADGNGVTLSYLRPTYSTATGDAGDAVTGLDRFGRVIDQRWSYASGAIDEQRYAYDRDGNVLGRRNVVLPGQSEAYTYDGLNRLATFARGTLNAAGTAVAGTPTTTESWQLDAVGNWNGNTKDGTTTARTNSAQNQIKTVGSATLAYDANGNTLADDKGQRYTYDAWNRLVTVKDSAGTTLAAYTYDAQNRRVTEQHGTATTALYYSDRSQVLEERQGGTTMTQYTWSAFYVNDQVARDDHAPGTGGTSLNRRLYPTRDVNYDTTALTTSSGSVVERYAYTSYGQVAVFTAAGAVVGTGIGSSAYANRYLFQTGRFDAATGLGQFGARDYDPGLGRWREQDPAGYVDGASRYQFTVGNPICFVDPQGLATGDGKGFSMAGMFEQPFKWAGQGVQLGAGVAGQVVNAPAQVGGEALKISGGIAGQILRPISAKAGNVITGAGNSAGNAMQGLGSAAQGATTYGGNLLGEEVSRIPEFATNLPEATGQIGGAMLGGMFNAIKHQFFSAPSGDLLIDVWDMPNQVLGGLIGWLGILHGGHLQQEGCDMNSGHSDVVGIKWPSGIPNGAVTFGDFTPYGLGFMPTDLGLDGNPAWQHEGKHSVQGDLLGITYLPANLIGGFVGILTAPPGTQDTWHSPGNFMESGPQSHPPRPFK